jgi:hypothetical protein
MCSRDTFDLATRLQVKLQLDIDKRNEPPSPHHCVFKLDCVLFVMKLFPVALTIIFIDSGEVIVFKRLAALSS